MVSPKARRIVHVVVATEADRGIQGWAVRGHNEWVSGTTAGRLQSKAPSPFFLEQQEIPPILAGVPPEAFASDRNIEAIHVSVSPTENDFIATFSGTICDPSRPDRPWRIITRVFQIPEVAWEELGGDAEALLYRIEDGAPRATEWFSRALPARFRGESTIPTITPTLDVRQLDSGSVTCQRLNRLRWFASRLDRPIEVTAKRIAQIHHALIQCWHGGGGLILPERAESNSSAIEARLAWLSLPAGDRRRVPLSTGQFGDLGTPRGLSVVRGSLPGRLPDGCHRFRSEKEPRPSPHWVAHVMSQLDPGHPKLDIPRELSLLDGEFALWTHVLTAENAYRRRPDAHNLTNKLRSRLAFPDPLREGELQSLVDDIVGGLEPSRSWQAIADTLDSILNLPYPERQEVSELNRRVLHELLDAPIASWRGAAAWLIMRYLEEGSPALDETDGLTLLRHEAQQRDQNVLGPIGFLEEKARSSELLFRCLHLCGHRMVDAKETSDWGRRMAMEPSKRYRRGLTQLPQPRSPSEAHWVLALLEGYLRQEGGHTEPLPLPGWLLSLRDDSLLDVRISDYPALALQQLEQTPEEHLLLRLRREGIATSLFVTFILRWTERHLESLPSPRPWPAWAARIQAAHLSLRAVETELVDRLGTNSSTLPAWWLDLVTAAMTLPGLRKEAFYRCAEGLESTTRLKWAKACLAALAGQISDDEVVRIVAHSIFVVTSEEPDREEVLKVTSTLRPANPAFALRLVRTISDFEEMHPPGTVSVAANVRRRFLRVWNDWTSLRTAREREAFFRLWWWDHEPGTSSPALPGFEQLSLNDRRSLIDWLLRGTPPAPLYALLKRYERECLKNPSPRSRGQYD